MPKLRAKNDRSGIADLGAHHLYKAPRIPNPRTTAEDFCRVYHGLKVGLLHNEAVVKNAAKAVVRKQFTDNIEKLKTAKSNVSQTKEIMFSHIMECENCK